MTPPIDPETPVTIGFVFAVLARVDELRERQTGEERITTPVSLTIRRAINDVTADRQNGYGLRQMDDVAPEIAERMRIVNRSAFMTPSGIACPVCAYELVSPALLSWPRTRQTVGCPRCEYAATIAVDGTVTVTTQGKGPGTPPTART